MEHFDIDIANDIELSSFVGEEKNESAKLDDYIVTPSAPPQRDGKTSTTDASKPSWQQALQSYQQTVKDYTDYGADKSGYGYYEKFRDPQGERKRILGLDPLVFIAVSIGLIIASGIAIVVLKPKGAK